MPIKDSSMSEVRDAILGAISTSFKHNLEFSFSFISSFYPSHLTFFFEMQEKIEKKNKE